MARAKLDIPVVGRFVQPGTIEMMTWDRDTFWLMHKHSDMLRVAARLKSVALAMVLDEQATAEV